MNTPSTLLNCVVWYAGGEPTVGRVAKDQLNELGLGVFGDIVRSPKMFLGSPLGIDIGGVTRSAVDVVADVLRYLREDALNRGYRGNTFEVAVMTIPVSMRGPARAELRQAAAKAGIRIHQFVHEPLAALYGHLRGQRDFVRRLAALEGSLVLVFDWGGGTLDLTLCHVKHGTLTQVFNLGDPEVGGDHFDLRVRQIVRDKHEAMYPAADWSRIQTSAEARMIQACEDAKIALSTREKTAVYISDILATSGREKDLRIELTRQELDAEVSDLISRGLSRIEDVFHTLQFKKGNVEFCLATGGMVAMPAIQQGLREIFGMNRLRLAEDAPTLIAEGAAWIAHDGVGLRLAKPLELLHANDAYVEVIGAGTALPVEGKSVQMPLDMYCADPRDGIAKFLFARPQWPNQGSQGDPRIPYTILTLPVDRYSRPLLERLKVNIHIDHNLIAEVRARSTMRDVEQRTAIHDLEFGLQLGANATRAEHLEGTQ